MPAASGLKDFEQLLNAAAWRAPLGELVGIMDVGFTCAYLATPDARLLSGETMYRHFTSAAFATFVS